MGEDSRAAFILIFVSYLQKYVWVHLPQKAKKSDLRWAAILYPGALFLIAGWRWYRTSLKKQALPTSSTILFVVGAVLLVALLLPGVNEKIYLTILRIAAIFGWVIGRVALTIIFYLVVTTMGLLMRLLGKDFLDEKFKTGKPPQWRVHDKNDEPRRYYRLF